MSDLRYRCGFRGNANIRDNYWRWREHRTVVSIVLNLRDGKFTCEIVHLLTFNVWDNCPRVEVIWWEWAWLEVRHALSWMATNQTAFHYRWSQATSTLGKVLIHSMLSHFPLTLTHWDWWRLFRVFLMHLCNCMFVVGKLFGLMWFRNSSTRCFVKTIQFQHSNELGLVESASCIMSRQLEFEWEPL